MLHSLYDTAAQLLTQSPHAYLVLYAMLAVGIAGMPLPDEIMLAFAGYNAYAGKLHIVPAILAAFLGSSTGLTISYLLGRGLGYPVVMRYGRYFFIPPEKLERAHNWFHRRGKWTLTFSIFIPSIRHILAIAAGTSKMEMKSFSFFAYLGSFLWTTAFVLFGFALGGQFPMLRGRWESLSNQMHLIILIAVGAGAGLLLVYVIARKINRARKPRDTAPENP
jgi:membrane protein DedA with SNARE-associated domain